MRRGLRSILVTVAIALAAGLSGVWAGGKLMHVNDPPSLHDAVHRDLNLDTEQTRAIDALETAFAARKAELEADMRRANAELAQAIQASAAVSPEIETAISHFHAAMGALQTETVQHVFAMRGVLRPEQRARFDALVVKALTAAPQ